MPAPAATESAIRRALDAARASGLAVTSFSVARDGTVTVLTCQPVDSGAESAQSHEPKRWNRRG